MSASQFLLDSDIARYYLQAGNTVRPGESPVDLEPRVQNWLDRANMGHRSALAVAVEVAKLRPEPAPAPLPTPQEAAWLQNQADGIGDQRPLSADQALANHIQSLTLAEWAQERVRLGLTKNLVDFLGGA